MKTYYLIGLDDDNKPVHTMKVVVADKAKALEEAATMAMGYHAVAVCEPEMNVYAGGKK